MGFLGYLVIPLLVSPGFFCRLRTLPGGQGQRLDPPYHGPEESPGQMALGQQPPIVPGVLDQSAAGLHQPLLRVPARGPGRGGK